MINSQGSSRNKEGLQYSIHKSPDLKAKLIDDVFFYFLLGMPIYCLHDRLAVCIQLLSNYQYSIYRRLRVTTS